jgi:glutathione S-transferase
MPILYYYRNSPFSRRTRLALMHKGVQVELRELAQNAEWVNEARALVPTRTFPVLADGPRAMGDSNVIARWLDAAYPSTPRLWPTGDEALQALEVAALADFAVHTTADLGTRYFALRGDPAWSQVKGEMLGRVERVLDALAERAAALGRPTVVASGWSVADIWLFTFVAWMEALPGRVGAGPNVAQILSLGLKVPPALSTWAAQHRGRPDVEALG